MKILLNIYVKLSLFPQGQFCLINYRLDSLQITYNGENIMDLIDRIKDISLRVPKQIEHIQTEEATKNAFIMPFISSLGYNVFNPLEVIPEFTADVGKKKVKKLIMPLKKTMKSLS